jgi:hypothetical protein
LLSRFKQLRKFSAASFQSLGAKWKILLHGRSNIMFWLTNQALHCQDKYFTNPLHGEDSFQEVYVWFLPTVLI